jgi:hypothetical protein
MAQPYDNGQAVLEQLLRPQPPLKSSLRLSLPQWEWIHGFVLLQILLQILLLIPALSDYRMLMRGTAFGASLLLWVGLRQKGSPHPAKPWAIAVLILMALQLFWHPHLNSPMAGTAQCLMYLSILGPLFWASRLRLTFDSFRWLVFILWGFHTLSALVGVLQVYYPNAFHFAISSKVRNSVYGADQFLIMLANGQLIHRPSGLTDIPGAAAQSGFYALLLGIGIALVERNLLVRLLGVASIPLGFLCIYLSQVRSILVLSIVCLIVLVLMLLRLGKFWQFALLLASISAIAMLTFSWASSVGGDATIERLATLISDRPDTIYYQNRGVFLEETFLTLLPEFPLGAGLGRWGMMYSYFGDFYNPLTYPIWAEIQWTGWLLDGGLPMMIAYPGALLLACYGAWQVAMNRWVAKLQIWGAIVLAYNVGAIAITFNYPLFMSQMGMEFWLINTVLFVAATRRL